MKGVAFLQTDITDEKDIAGASRFFIDIFRQYHLQPRKKFDLFFLTDKKSTADLHKDPSYKHCAQNILGLRSPNNRFNNLVANLDMLFKILFHQIKLLHICQYYHVTHYERLSFLQRLPAFMRPKLVVNWIHCNFPYEYFDKDHPSYPHFHDRFDPLFNNIKLDGMFSWYELTKTFIEEHHLIKNPLYIHPVKTYCCNTDKYFPAPNKENSIVWAARLHKQKRPELFVKAVHHLYTHHPAEIKGWKFLLCGSGGTEENNLRALIKELQVEKVLDFLTEINDMSTVFATSRCFVSTQDYENFTSLSMNEALAAGNAIVSRNVGQTGLYVADEKNGFLAKEDSPAGIADAILRYISVPEKHAVMQDFSVDMTKKVHSPENFMKELDTFWNKLITKN